MKLTEEQKKDLRKFSLILNSLNLEDGLNYVYRFYDSDWEGPEGPYYKGRKSYEPGFLPKSIESFFDEVKDEFDTENFYNDHYDSYNGSLNFEIIAEKRQIVITYDYYQLNTEDTEIVKTFQELVNTPLPWYRNQGREDEKLLDQNFINQMLEKYGKFVIVNYEGSGDSGWLDENVQSDKDTELDGRLEHIAYELIDLFHSGWENNEGSNGNMTIDFKNKTVRLVHYQNYEEEMEETYMRIEF